LTAPSALQHHSDTLPFSMAKFHYADKFSRDVPFNLNSITRLPAEKSA